MITTIMQTNETSRRESWKRIATFLLLAFGFSSVFYTLMITGSGSYLDNPYLLFGLMWCPGVAALLTRLIWDRTVRGFGWGWGAWRYHLEAYSLPILYGAVMYGAIWTMGLGGFPNAAAIEALPDTGSTAASIALFFLTNGTIAFLLGAVPSALGEEIGWRGFLVPELNKVMSFTSASFLSGVMWMLFHLPVLLLAGYNNGDGAPVWFGLTCFTVAIFGYTFAMNWLRLRSGSLWPAVWLHASHNVFIKNTYESLTVPTTWTPYLTDEFGLGIVAVILVVAYYYWRRRRELHASDSEEFVTQPEALPHGQPV